MKVTIPLKTVSLLNQREVWQVTAARKKLQRDVVTRHLAGYPKPQLPVTVFLTRVAPGRLDPHDNLPSSMKHVVDAIAAWMGVDDGSDGVKWLYDQKNAQKGQYAVEVEFV
jgi:hypothetical protein